MLKIFLKFYFNLDSSGTWLTGVWKPCGVSRLVCGNPVECHDWCVETLWSVTTGLTASRHLCSSFSGPKRRQPLLPRQSLENEYKFKGTFSSKIFMFNFYFGLLYLMSKTGVWKVGSIHCHVSHSVLTCNTHYEPKN